MEGFSCGDTDYYPVIIHLTIDGEEIETTPEHPFYSEGKWITAEDLQLGDPLQTSDRTTGTVEKIESENRVQANGRTPPACKTSAPATTLPPRDVS